MNQTWKVITTGSLSLALAGCFNLGTKPSEITPAYVPESQYQNQNCQQLDADRQDMYRRKSMLETAQTQRRHSNKVQAFWVGFGNGDGVGASELAQVKGEILAVEKQLALKGCTGAQSAYSATSDTQSSSPTYTGWPLSLPQFDIADNCRRSSTDPQVCMASEQNARTWLLHHTTPVQVAGECSQFAQQDQSYEMIQSCVQQHEGMNR